VCLCVYIYIYIYIYIYTHTHTHIYMIHKIRYDRKCCKFGQMCYDALVPNITVVHKHAKRFWALSSILDRKGTCRRCAKWGKTKHKLVLDWRQVQENHWLDLHSMSLSSRNATKLLCFYPHKTTCGLQTVQYKWYSNTGFF
jgi:hypothetical protein